MLEMIWNHLGTNVTGDISDNILAAGLAASFSFNNGCTCLCTPRYVKEFCEEKKGPRKGVVIKVTL